jgi:secreted trypsin-like serine protease
MSNLWMVSNNTSKFKSNNSINIQKYLVSLQYESSPHLLSGEVIIETRDKCDTTNNKITSTTLCAGPYFVNGCESDDGSPLVCNKKICGLIDYRPQSYCSHTITDRLGTYLDLSEFHDWIAERAASKRVVTSASIIFLSGVIMKLLN